MHLVEGVLHPDAAAVGYSAQPGAASGRLLHDDAQLKPGESGAEAEVTAAPEPHVGLGVRRLSNEPGSGSGNVGDRDWPL